MKKVRIQATDLGEDILTLDVYHTAITGSNLLSGSVSKAQMLAGIDVFVDDNVTTFIAQSTAGPGPCHPASGSITVAPYNPNVRFFEVGLAHPGGTVQQISPFSGPATAAGFSQSVDYRIYTTFTIQANATYPWTFQGWYTGSGASAGSLISTSNPLSITLNQYTASLEDSIFAGFSTTHINPFTL
jgi:hypothetical protein